METESDSLNELLSRLSIMLESSSSSSRHQQRSETEHGNAPENNSTSADTPSLEASGGPDSTTSWQRDLSAASPPVLSAQA